MMQKIMSVKNFCQGIVFTAAVIAATVISALAVAAPNAPPEMALSSTIWENGTGALKDPQLERRARAITSELRCLVCQSESLEESNAELALDIKRLVREKLVGGDSNQTIINELVKRYGDFIHLKPPFSARTIVLWVFPLAVLGTAILMIWRRMREKKSISAFEGKPFLAKDLSPPIAADDSDFDSLDTNNRDLKPKNNWLSLTLASGFAIIAAFGLYLLIGRPDLPDLPMAMRTKEKEITKMTEQDRQAMINSMVDGLAKKLEESPNDPAGWLRLAQSRMVQGDRVKMQQALANGAKYNPQSLELLLAYGRSLIPKEAQAPLPEELVKVMRQVLTLAPNQPEALWLVARAEITAGRRDKSDPLLRKLLMVIPKDAPVRSEIEQVLTPNK